MCFKDDDNWSSNDGQYPGGDGGNSSGRYWGTNWAYTNMWITNVGGGTGISSWSDNRQEAITVTNRSSTTGITASSSNVGTGTSFSILSPYLNVNYIMKY
jgi:hypothetical protein